MRPCADCLRGRRPVEGLRTLDGTDSLDSTFAMALAGHALISGVALLTASSMAFWAGFLPSSAFCSSTWMTCEMAL